MGPTSPMEYYSYADLTHLIMRNLSLVPRDIDLVVAVPPAGLLAGTLIALTLNRPVMALDAFLGGFALNAEPFRHALIVHDCGVADAHVATIREQLNRAVARAARFTHLAPLVGATAPASVDIHFATAAPDCHFEWQWLHHPQLGEACVDIDGVLCVDPTDADNDDGENYRTFLLNAPPHLLPSQPIRHLVTSRLERWRPETEAWLHRIGVKYDRLTMLNVRTAAERRRLGNHAAHKARAYAADTGATLFIESEVHQAQAIAEITGKPALCIANQKLYLRGKNLSPRPPALARLWSMPRAFARRTKNFLLRS